MNQTPMLILAGMMGVVIAIIILKQPFIGVALTVISTPISSLLPPIPYFSSVVPLIGGLTLVGFLWIKRDSAGRIGIKFNLLHTITLLLFIWIFISNPQAAWSGPDRNWVITFIQLLILMIIAGSIIDEPYKHHILMGLFVFVSVISAYTAITQGYLGEDILEATRVGGFTAGANTAARYFVIAMVLLTYLRSQVKVPFVRLLMLGGILITYLGVFFTASRSGMVLIFFAQLLLFFFQHEGKQRIQLLVIFGIAFLILFLMANTIIVILQGIIPAITQGTDTMGLRYDLWEAGWLMWQDHPISGVGIGMFRYNVGRYMSLIGVAPRGATSHNTYINMLSETGIIGFSLFMIILGLALKDYLKVGQNPNPDLDGLRTIWLIVFLVLLVGAITKTEHTDKLLFMVMGLSVYFATLAKTSVEEKLQMEKARVEPGTQRFANRF